MRFRHLDYPEDAAVTDLGPAALDALLERGDLDDWRPLARAVLEDPFGDVADKILRLCEAHPMYGTSELWRTFIERAREGFGPETVDLATLRRRARLTQSEVGERMGISQSDVSKLERRPDVRLSTLHRYVEMLGGRLRIEVDVARRTVAVDLGADRTDGA